MAIGIRSGENESVSVTTEPQLIWSGSSIKDGPQIQNVGDVGDLIYVWVGRGTPTSSSPAFVLQQYGFMSMDGSIQDKVYIWGSIATTAIVNKAN